MANSAQFVARAYPNVNATLGPAWYEYGVFILIWRDLSGRCSTHISLDAVQVQWGYQDDYEIVRKVGRGKYSEVCGT